MAGVQIDAHEVRELAQDLGRVAGRAVPLVDKVVEKASVNIKNDLNEQAAGSSFRGMAGSVNYDRTRSLGGFIGSEIGPDKSRRGGALGNLFFFGGANGGGGTGDLDGAMKRESEKFVKALGDVLGDVL